ncbi:MAG: hypothetical protein RL701_2172 [Pseudomonadota bacterium]
MLRITPRFTSLTRVVLALTATSLALTTLVACEKEANPPGQLIVSFETDMAMPQQIDSLHISVLLRGRYFLDDDYQIGGGSDPLIPATLTLAAEDGLLAPVTVRVAGRKQGSWRTFRELTSVIPQDRTAILRMPVQWLCDATAKATPMVNSSGISEVRAASTCDEGFTCRAGQCEPSVIDVETLPVYEPSAVFGGAGNGDDGACFDTVACMAPGWIATPDADCSIARPAGENINVALRVVRDGICDATDSTCFVPLDGESPEGYLDSSRLKLPAAVCRKLDDGSVRAIYVSTSCPMKTAATPPCGLWSSVPWDHAVTPGDTSPPRPVVSLVTTLPSRAAGSLGPGTPCCPLSSDADKLYSCVCDTGAKTNASVYEVKPAGGSATLVATVHPREERKDTLFFSATAAKGVLYWVLDRNLERTQLAGGTALPTVAVDAALYDTASLPVDDKAAYGLANVISDGDSVVKLVVVGVEDGLLQPVPLDTGAGRPVLQFDQDAQALYMAKDIDSAATQANPTITRNSRVVRIPKNGAAANIVMPALDVMTAVASHGGYVGVLVDETRVFALFEETPDDKGWLEVQLLSADIVNPRSVAAPELLFSLKYNPATTLVTLLGVVDGIPILVRTDFIKSAPDKTVIVSSSVISVTLEKSRILADFERDAPLVGLARDNDRIYWLNQSGALYGFARSALP